MITSLFPYFSCCFSDERCVQFSTDLHLNLRAKSCFCILYEAVACAVPASIFNICPPLVTTEQHRAGIQQPVCKQQHSLIDRIIFTLIHHEHSVFYTAGQNPKILLFTKDDLQSGGKVSKPQSDVALVSNVSNLSQ